MSNYNIQQNIACLACKVTCHQNQNIISCGVCKRPVHLECSKVGMNFGNHNYVCTECHHKKALLTGIVKSSIISLEDKNIARSENETLLSYYNIQDVNTLLQSKTNKDLFIVHLNASSLPLHFDSISSLFMDKMKCHPDIICITESRLQDKKIDYQLNFVGLPHYKLRYDNSPTRAGGVAVYVKDTLNFEVKSDLRLNVADCESLFIEFDVSPKKTNKRNTSKSFLLGCVYRHPRKTVAEKTDFIQQLYKTLEKYTCKNIPLTIFGDINIDVSKVDNNTVRHYTNLLKSIGCENLIDTHTQFREKSRSILDHIITNIDQDRVTSGVIDFPITDHLPIFAIIKNQVDPIMNKNDKSKDTFWQYIDDRKKEEFLTILENKLKSIDLSEHPEKILESLTISTKASIDSCFPIKKQSNRAKKRAQTPWFDTEIFKEEKIQTNLFRRFIKSKTPEDHQIYKSFRNKLSKKKYKAKRKFYQDLLNDAKNSGDKSITWDIINKAFGKKKKSRKCPEKVLIGDPKNPTESTADKDIADALNKHFTNIAQNLVNKLKKTSTQPSSFMGKKNKSSMFMKFITLDEIIEEIKNICIKKAIGYDGIPPKIIKWAPKLFSPILLEIYNKCIDMGYYPQSMKVAKVTPIHKKDDKNDLNNYRPISVLTQFNQIFERLLSKRLLSFVNKCNLITKKQFGFLKKHSTEHAILDLKEYILKHLEKKQVTALLFLDLQKAFDTVSHTILLEKLKHYGIRGNVLRLFASYLSGRKQFTKIGNVLSDLSDIFWGVPQGSVLGPLLFLVFINDLPASCNMWSWLFADDTALALSSRNYHDLEIKFNLEVAKVQNWLLANGLSVHYTDKTKYMLIQGPGQNLIRGTSTNFRLNMGGYEIERTDHYTYLGIIFDDKLNWKKQINKMCSKLAKVCGVVSKVRHYLDRGSVMLIYNSLFESRLRYGILGWGTASECDLHKLKVLQNRVARFITFSPFYRTALIPIYANLRILPLQDQLNLQKAIFMHSFYYGTLPYTLSLYCNHPMHDYSTRYTANKNYFLPFANTNRDQTSIKFDGPKVWADVPKQLKEIAFRKPFSRKMKEYKISILVDLSKNIPSNSHQSTNDQNNCEELKAIFDESTDSKIDFLGFDVPSLEEIFHSDDENIEFYGFDECEGIETIFDSDNENETEFFGFRIS